VQALAGVKAGDEHRDVVHIGGLDSARDLGPPRDGASQHRSQTLGFLRNGEQPASRAIRRLMRIDSAAPGRESVDRGGTGDVDRPRRRCDRAAS
jgi:hypothetical protein